MKMTMSSAVAFLFSDFEEDASSLLVRPLSWKGSGSAVTANGDGKLIVLNPFDRGEHHFSPYAYEIIEKWEHVKLQTILDELEHNNKPPEVPHG